MLTYKNALKLLKSLCPTNVITHSLLVSKKSEELAKQISKNKKIDIELCKVGGLLHDIGRSKTHSIQHGIKGSEILKTHPKLKLICERHIGGGIPKEDTVKLNLPLKDYLPLSLEEKVVCYADKFIQNNKIEKNISKEYDKLNLKFGKNNNIVKRLKRIENEIKKFITEK